MKTQTLRDLRGLIDDIIKWREANPDNWLARDEADNNPEAAFFFDANHIFDVTRTSRKPNTR